MRVLAGMLRVAIALDRTHAGVVRDVHRATTSGAGLLVEPTSTPGADASLELYTAEERRDLLAETLGVDVRIEATAAEPAPFGARS